jgi:pyruvate dehydrogenase E2 component (dihydrolipoamide acetyltransferase)
MMAKLTAISMPKWGMEMTEGEIVGWHVAAGDAVSAGSDIADVETAKIVNTVTSDAAGTVARLCADIGDTLPVGGLLAVLADGAAPDAEIDDFIAARGGAPGPDDAVAAPGPEDAPVTPAVQPADEGQPAPAAGALADGPDDSSVPASPVARRVAKDNHINLNNVTGSGRHGRVSLRDLREAAEGAGQKLGLPAPRAFDRAIPEDDGGLRATPVARRLARELGISLHDCRSTGRHGRISKADVEAAAARLGGAPGPAPGARSPASDAPAAGPGARLESLSGSRRAIAGAVSRSKREVPHFRVHLDVDVAAAMALRESLNARRSDVRVSLNDILIKACAVALKNNPALNARFDGETLERHAAANIASAVATDSGVVMPVLENVGGLGLVDISAAMRDLATRAKTGRLSLDEMNAATFSISNLGMFGISAFDAIINQPAVAILAVGAAGERPVVRQGELGIGQVMTLSLSSDHRVVDGAEAARFLADLRDLLEQPAMMLG